MLMKQNILKVFLTTSLSAGLNKLPVSGHLPLCQISEQDYDMTEEK